MQSDDWKTHLVQHHIADGWEPLGLLYAGGHELEAQQEVSVVLPLSTGLRQICGSKEQRQVSCELAELSVMPPQQ